VVGKSRGESLKKLKVKIILFSLKVNFVYVLFHSMSLFMFPSSLSMYFAFDSLIVSFLLLNAQK